MSDSEAMREAAREVLRELLPEVLGARQARNGNGHPAPAPPPDAIPLVPAPPVAAVLRPSTWAAPAAPGEVIGDGATPPPEPPPPPDDAEPVTIDTDADLERFVASLLARFENPRDRRALRTGRLRFTLRRAAPAGGAARDAPAIHIDKGAVTERVVREAAGAGARLVLARRAVLTPLARDQARALRVVIEREDT